MSTSSLAYNNNIKVNKYIIDEYNNSHGFPLNTVRSITQTSNGYLWFIGEKKGLYRYDGVRFQKIDLGPYSEAPLYKIYSGRQFWLCSKIGLLSFDGHKTNIHISKNQLEKNEKITYIFENKDGILYLGSSKGNLYIKSEGKLEKIKKFISVLSIIEDSNEYIWIAAGRSGLFYYKNGDIKKKSLNSQQPFSIRCLFESKNKTIWVGTNSGLYSLKKSPLKNGYMDYFNTTNGLTSNGINKIIEDDKNNIIIATGFGLNRILYKNQDKKIETLLDKSPVFDIFIDTEQSLWIATYLKYLKRFRETTFSHISNIFGGKIYQPCLYRENNNDIWVGTITGNLIRMTDFNIKSYIKLNSVNEMGIRAICRDKDKNLWIGTLQNGFYLFKNNKLYRQKKRQDNENDGIRTIFCDSKKRVWIGTIYGIYCYENNQYSFFSKKDGLIDNSIHQIYEDSNKNIWICTALGLSFIKDGIISKKNINNILIGKNIINIMEDRNDKDTFWIGTSGDGLFRKKHNILKNIKKKDGLGSNFILKIIESKQGDFWFSTYYDGIIKIRKSSINNFFDQNKKELQAKIFGKSDGLQILNGFFHSDNTVIKTKKGELFFSMENGIAIVDPNNIKVNKTPPNILIKNIYFNGQKINKTKNIYKGIKHIRFEYEAITFLARDKVKFKTKLEGFDLNWKQHSSIYRNEIVYDNIPSGEYTFKVNGCNGSGIWNRKGDSFYFILKPYFYESIWFKISLIFFIISLLIFIYFGIKKYRYFKRIENKYKGSNLEKDKSKQYLKQILSLIEQEKLYLDSELSLFSLAKKLAIKPKDLSQIINENLNKNFNDFINYYRVKEAIRLLESFNKDVDSITNLCFDVGFNSKTPFYRNFKKFTGKTPLQYFNEIKNSS